MSFVLVTAGATRNPVDAIRYLSANASGRTGVAIAQALDPHHDVLLLGSVEANLRAGGLKTEEYGSTRDLMARMEAHLRAHPDAVVVHSAAVGDYEAEPRATKTPSGQPELVLRLRPAPKILDQVRGWAPRAFLVSFKAASPELDLDTIEAIARAQLGRTGSDLVFANRLGALDATTMLVGRDTTTRFVHREDAVAALIAAIRDRSGHEA